MALGIARRFALIVVKQALASKALPTPPFQCSLAYQQLGLNPHPEDKRINLFAIPPVSPYDLLNPVPLVQHWLIQPFVKGKSQGLGPFTVTPAY